MRIYFLRIVPILLLMASCNSASSKSVSEDSNTPDFNDLVMRWNNAHTVKDIGVISGLYHNSILYYGTSKKKNDCIENKLSLFRKYPNYNQQIFGEIETEQIDANTVKCSFVKRVTFNQQTKDYPSYLIFTKLASVWKISTEGDLVTDKNLTKQKEVKVPKGAIKGDFNGDGTLDYMWLVAPKTNNAELDCVGECISYIKFSDPTIPSIKVDQCIGGTPNNLGDLNKDGTDEIGLLPGWFSSCWRRYYVWTIKNQKWIHAVDPIITHCNQWEEGIRPIEEDISKPGYVLVRYSAGDGGVEIKTKSVKIR